MEKQNHKQLPKYIYRYKGQQVFLADTSDMPGVEPLAVANDIGCYPKSLYNGCHTCETYDDAYQDYVGQSEIVIADVINVETSEGSGELCDGEWVSQDYAACDKVYQKLCRKDFIGSELREIIGDVETKTKYGWNGTWDNVIAYTDFFDIAEEWNATIRQYKEEYEESVTEDNPYDFPDVMSLEDICNQEGIIVSLSDTEVEILAQNCYMERIDTTSDAGGYPSEIHPAIIGFDSFEEAEKMAEENHLDICIFARRNGWDLWHREEGRAYDAFERSGECVMDYEENDWHYAIGLIGLNII